MIFSRGIFNLESLLVPMAVLIGQGNYLGATKSPTLPTFSSPKIDSPSSTLLQRGSQSYRREGGNEVLGGAQIIRRRR